MKPTRPDFGGTSRPGLGTETRTHHSRGGGRLTRSLRDSGGFPEFRTLVYVVKSRYGPLQLTLEPVDGFSFTDRSEDWESLTVHRRTFRGRPPKVGNPPSRHQFYILFLENDPLQLSIPLQSTIVFIKKKKNFD